MTPDEYVHYILKEFEVQSGSHSPVQRNAQAIFPALRQWAGNDLAELLISGSYAKQTAVRGSTDIDIFISLQAGTSRSLQAIFEGLFQFASSQAWEPRRQNVSIGITHNGTSIDLVPGRIQRGYHNYHSLYLRRRDSWIQTNVKLHIDKVVRSNRADEIRAVKIWRNLRGLDFPSFYLELTTIEALAYRPTASVANNVITVLEYLESTFPWARVIDPANSNNIVSEDLTAAEKKSIVDQARLSTQATNWSQIIWF